MDNMNLDTSSLSLNLDDEEKSFKNVDVERLIDGVNKLLSGVGIQAKAIVSFDELKRVAPSMFVAVYESLYHNRIDEIIRAPRTVADYVYNAQLVINNLSDQINVDLAHITGESIVEGDLEALSNLTHIFSRIVSLTTSNVSLSTIESDEEDHREPIHQHRFFPTFGHDQESISTKDSLLEMKRVQKPVPKRKLPNSTQAQASPRESNPSGITRAGNRMISVTVQKKQRPLSADAAYRSPQQRGPIIPTTSRGTFTRTNTPTRTAAYPSPRRAQSPHFATPRRKVIKPSPTSPFSVPSSAGHRHSMMQDATSPMHQQQVDKLFHDALHRIEQHTMLNEKLQKASLQRKRIQSLKQMQTRQQNHHTWKTSQGAFQQRWEKEQHTTEKADCLRIVNEESVTMRKVYDALFRQSVRYQADAKRADNEQLRLIKREFKDQIDCVENYFRDRIELTTAKETKTNTMSRADYDNILCTITSKWEHALDMSTQNLHESKVRERQLRNDAWKTVLASVDHSNWEDYLRVYPN